MTKSTWIKKQTKADDFEVINVKKWDDYKDFKMDKGCYVLIKLYTDRYEIGVGICDYDNVLIKEFRGRRPQDIYNAIFEYSEKHNLNWFQGLDHAAYLGKELKRAELCLALGTTYVQE